MNITRFKAGQKVRVTAENTYLDTDMLGRSGLQVGNVATVITVWPAPGVPYPYFVRYDTVADRSEDDGRYRYWTAENEIEEDEDGTE